jgi:chorismate synthase
LIKNKDSHSRDYESLRDTPRPSHADLTASYKYHGFEDYRGGGHFSGRITAALVAAGAIVRSALEKKGIFIGTHISRAGGIDDRAFCDICADIKELSHLEFPVLDGAAAEKILARIEAAAADGDSIGGILETAVTGLPEGVGEPWFDTVEGVLAHALYSVPAVKGVEFGAGFAFADMTGSEANDPFMMKNGRVQTASNNNGGVNGGITNGMPIIFRTAIKPTPSIFKEQETVSLSRGENTTLKITGRHDPAIIHRARAVVDAVTALALADLLTVRYGTDYLRRSDEVNL